MAEVGEVRAKFVAETDEWDTNVSRAAQSVEDAQDSVERSFRLIDHSANDTSLKFVALSDEVKAACEKMKDELFQAQAAAEQGFGGFGVASDKLHESLGRLAKPGRFSDFFRDIHEMSSTAASGFAGISTALGGFTSSLEQTREKTKAILKDMKGAFGDNAQEMTRLAEKQLEIGIDPRKAADTLINLKHFGQATEANLKLIENVAAGTGRSMEGIALKLGNTFELLESNSPKAAGAVKSLAKEMGATEADLAKFGARLDENGKILADTPARARDVQKALTGFANSQYAGAADRMASSSTRLKGEMELLKREISAGAVPLREQMAPALLKVVQGLRSLSPELKSMIGSGAEMANTFVSMTSGALGTASQLALLGSNAKVATLAAQGLNAAIAAGAPVTLGAAVALGGVVVALGALLILYHETLAAAQDWAEAQQKLNEQNEKQEFFLKKQQAIVGKTAEDLKRMGKTAKDVTEAILALQLEVEKANAKGDKARVKEIQDQITQLQNLRSQVAGSEADKRQKEHKGDPNFDPDAPSRKEKEKADRAAKAQERKDRAAAERDRKNEVRDAIAEIHQLAATKKITHLEEIDRLKDLSRLHVLDAGQQRQINNEIARLEGADLKKKEADEKKARADKLQSEHDGIKALAAAKTITKDQEIAQLQELITRHNLAGKERQRIELEIAHLKGQLESDHTRIAAREEAKRKKDADNARKSSLKDAIAAIEEEANAKRISVREEIDGLKRIRAEKAKTADEKRGLDLKISTLEGKVKSGEIKDEHQAQKDRDEIARLNKGKASAQEKEIDTQIRNQEDVHKETGANTVGQITQLYNRKLAIQIAEINAEKRAVQEKTHNAEVVKAAEEEAQAKIREAHAETTRKIREEADKQKAIHDKKKASSAFADGPYGLEDLGKQQAASFGGQAVNDRIEEIKAQSRNYQLSPALLSPPPSSTAGLGVRTFDLPPAQASQTTTELAKMNEALKAMSEKLSITIQVNMPDGSSQSKTFSGTSNELARAMNTMSAKAPMGGF